MESRAHVIKRLKRAVWLYLLFGVFIASLNMGVAPRLNAESANRIRQTYLIFETIIRTAFVLYGGFLMLKIYDNHHNMRRQSIASLIMVMSVLFVILPVLTGYYEFIFAFMPFPWSTYPLQVMHDGMFFSVNVQAAFGGNGVNVMLTLYVVFQVAVFAAVAFKGRRQFCAMMCPFSGCHAETFAEALPLVSEYHMGREGMSPNVKLGLVTIKLILLLLNFTLMLLWVLVLLGVKWFSPDVLRTFELVKYIGLELMLFYFSYLWINGRGYCYTCPAGTTLSLWGLLFGHGIETHHTSCISCGNCSKACEMNIPVMNYARWRCKIQTSLCVGCGHCVDSCPTQTLKLKGFSQHKPVHEDHDVDELME